MRAKHRPLGVEAVQFTGFNYKDGFTKPNVKDATIAYVDTPEGRRTVYPGWWMLEYADGSKRVVNNAGFCQLFFATGKADA